MKSPNMISITGRSPVTAAPNAAPAIASSEIGRVEDALVAEALVQLGRGHEHAAGGGHVLAEEDDRRVALDLLVERVADRGRGTRAGRVAHDANSVARSFSGSG